MTIRSSPLASRVTGGGSGLARVRSRGTTALAWLSWLVAAAGGSALAGTFLGGMISGVVGVFWPWFAALLLFAGLVAMGIDMFLDGVPNQLAITCAILLPSIARSVDGRLGAETTQVAARIRQGIDAWTVDWLGPAPTIGLAVTCIVAALLMARRVVAKGG